MKKLTGCLLASALMIPLLTGCGPRHDWGPDENRHYTQWENETHREHQDYDRRSRSDQNEYRDWRNHHRD